MYAHVLHVHEYLPAAPKVSVANGLVLFALYSAAMSGRTTVRRLEVVAVIISLSYHTRSKDSSTTMLI
jgi:hypothetical protein